ncbi:MAG: hypothetical protein ABI639_01960 [Thermoanaerobaculia bacterium]
MNTTDFDRDRSLRAALQPDADCPQLPALVEAALSGWTSADSPALREHATGCAACAAELDLLAAFDGTARNSTEGTDIAWVAGRIRIGAVPGSTSAAETPSLAKVLPISAGRAKRAKTHGEMPLSRRWAAAALVVLGLGVAFEWAHRNFGVVPPSLPGTSSSLDPTVVRGGEIVLESPQGEIAAETLREFAWRGVPGAASYRLEIRDVAGEILWQGSETANRLRVSPELAAKLATYVTYRWNVTALDVAGSALAHSATGTFALDPSSNGTSSGK